MSFIENRPHFIPSVISIIMLLGSFLDWPYAYYQILRFVVCGSAAYIAYLAYESERNWGIWLFGAIALLFNPLAPIHLSREIWQYIDIIVVGIFTCSIFILKKSISKKTTN